jgi:cell wall assembly regulator SMI1
MMSTRQGDRTGQNVVEPAVQRIVEEIIARAPAGWTEAVLESTVDPHHISVSGYYTIPGGPMWPSPGPTPFRSLGHLAEDLRRVRGWEGTSLEIRCRPSGEYGLVATADTITSRRGRAGGFQAVLDPGYRLPQPGYEQEGSTAGPEGDPALAVARLGECLERRAAILGRPQRLPPPASAAALDEAERLIGHPLPADLRALYLIADGDLADDEYRWVFGYGGWLALEDLVAAHAREREPFWLGWDLAWNWVVFDADPPQTVRRCGGHPAWLPFGTGEDGNYLAVDLAPARNGRPGQVIRIGRDHGDGPVYEAGSVTSLLGRQLELLERGAFEVDEGEIFLEEPACDPGPGRIIHEIPDELPPSVQAIYLYEATSPVDLTPLAASPNLRQLLLHRTADLTPLRSLPVESVRVTLDGGDLVPLAGHRSIASLDLGTTAPIDIAPLGTAPNLRCLDLSRASVRDLTVLRGLPDLRYLALTARQWSILLDAGPAPPGLACAHLADDASTDEALAWAAGLGLNIGEPFRASGTIHV